MLEELIKSKAQMEKDLNQECPFFYAAALNHISNNSSKSLSDWVDSKGNVDISGINTIINTVKKEIEEENNFNRNKEKINQQNAEFENENLNQFNEEFQKIDFDKLTSKDFAFIVQNYDAFINNTTNEQFGKVLEQSQKILGTTQQVREALQIGHKLRKGEPLTEEDKRNMNQIPVELLSAIGWNKQNNVFDFQKYDNVITEYVSIMVQLGECLHDDGTISEQDLDKLIKDHKELCSEVPGIIDRERILELSKNGQLKDFIEGAKQESSKLNDIEKVEITQTSLENNQKEEDTVSLNSIESLFDTMFAEMEDPANQYFEETIEQQEEQRASKEEIFEPTQEDQVRLEEEVIDDGEMEPELESEPESELEPESKEGMPEPEYETPTFEEEKTGLAGLVAAIANSKAVKAFRNLFKAKDEQKKLNAAVTQRTEDGVKITEYESNGSLMPTTIQARQALINFSVNTVKAITDFANNISNAIRRNDKEEPVINRPIIIGKESQEHSQEQSQQQEQQAEKAQEKAGTYLDNNQWAVSQEELKTGANKLAVEQASMSNESQVQNRGIKDDRNTQDDGSR